MDERKRPVDVVIARIATRQFGVIAWRQLIGLGLNRGAIEKRVLAGRLHPVHVGVYAVGHTHLSRSGRLMAAVLAFPIGAVLSHRTAAEIYCLLRVTATRPHVTSAERTLHGRPGIVLHRVRSLDPALTTEVDGLPVATVPRVLLDLAEDRRNDNILRRAWEEAQRRRLLDVNEVVRLIDESPGRRTRPLRALIAEGVDAPDTHEELEHRFAHLMRSRPDLPQPSYNVAIGPYIADAVWPGHGLIVELDGHAYHWHRRERDSERDADLLLADYFTYRVTWRALTRTPHEVIGRIERLLEKGAAWQAARAA